MKRFVFHISLISCFLFFNLIGQAQSVESGDVTNVAYENLKEEIGLNDTKKVVSLKENKTKKEEKKDDFKNPFGSAFGTGMNVLIYILIGMMFMLVFYLVYSNIEIEKKVESEAEEILEIESLEDIDPDLELENALLNKDYRTAIRMHFYKVLKKLDGAKKIEWTVEKTNRDFIREIENGSTKQHFRKLANIFEFVWYGNKQIDQDIYSSLEEDFVGFHKTNLL